MALAGKGVLFKSATTSGGTFNTVLELNDATMTIDGDNQDITEFGDDFVNRIQGLKDTSFSVSGFLDPNDTTGQVTIRDALVNDTELHVQFLHDGTNGFQSEVKVSTYETSASVDGVVELSIDLEGTGTITAVP